MLKKLTAIMILGSVFAIQVVKPYRVPHQSKLKIIYSSCKIVPGL
jgi:hypothetical protein